MPVLKGMKTQEQIESWRNHIWDALNDTKRELDQTIANQKDLLWKQRNGGLDSHYPMDRVYEGFETTRRELLALEKELRTRWETLQWVLQSYEWEQQIWKEQLEVLSKQRVFPTKHLGRTGGIEKPTPQNTIKEEQDGMV